MKVRFPKNIEQETCAAKFVIKIICLQKATVCQSTAI